MKFKKYLNLHISIPEEYFDLAYGILYEYPITGIEEKPDELIVSFELLKLDDLLKDNLIKELKSIIPDARILKEIIIEDRNWNEEFEKLTQIIKVSDRIGIAPQWKIDELNTEIKIIINPKMSFGTGEHSTTKLMCQLLEKVVRPGTKWIDAGCGTGILGILAVKLGANNVFAFDYDEWSVENSKENILANKVDNQIELIQEKIEYVTLSPADGIAANMFSNLLISAFPKFYTSLKDTDGDLLVSGILKYDKDEVINAAETNNFKLIEIISEDEWVAIHFKINQGNY